MDRFRNIAVGLLVVNDELLVQLGFDCIRRLAFCRAIGGEIEFGETAEKALRREFREELGHTVDAARLIGVVENLFEFEASSGHEIVHVFAVESQSLAAAPRSDELVVLDEGSAVRWVSVDEIRARRPPLFPGGVVDLLPK